LKKIFDYKLKADNERLKAENAALKDAKGKAEENWCLNSI
jgi:hypothetical protein